MRGHAHLDDLLAVLDHADAGPVWLAGASAGGGLALDAALAAPGRVAGLVVMGTAVSGAPEPELELDAGTRRLDLLLEAAYAARDVGEVNRLETWLWLDGPRQSEGRVGGDQIHSHSGSSESQRLLWMTVGENAASAQI